MIFDKLLERRSHPENPKYGILEALAGGGSHTYTGKTVNENTAITLSTVYACIRVLAETVASLPLHLYKRRSDGRGKDRSIEHPLYDILHNRPNSEMTSMVFREVLTSHVAGWGNSYAEVVKNKSDFITALWPLRPDKMQVDRDALGNLVYNYTTSKRTYTLPHDRVLHVPGLGFDGIQGYSPIAKARQAIGLGLATEEFGARWFGNGARPSGVLTHPEMLSPEAKQNIGKSWQDAFQGVEKSNKIAVLEEGIKYQPISISPEDSQFIDTRKFQVEEICRIFRVPLHLVQDLTHATFSNIEFQSIDFVIHTIRPWLVRFEQAFSQQLLSEKDRKIYFTEHLVDGLLRGDIKSRYEAYASGRTNGWLSANDIREKENLNPLEAGGDVYLVPLNMVPADQLGQSMPQEENALPITETRQTASIENIQRVKRSYRNLFEDAAQRIINKETSAITRLAKNQLRDKYTFMNKVDEFYKDLPEYIRINFMPAKQAFSEQVYRDALAQIGFDPAKVGANVDQWIRDYVDVYAKRHVGSSLGQIRKIANEAALAEAGVQVVERMNDWKKTRASKIAINETSRLGNFIALNAWKAGGIKRKRWVTVGKSCPYCEKMNGTVIEIEKNFLEQGDAIHAQYDATNEEGKVEKKWGTMSIQTGISAPPVHASCDCLVMWD